MKPCSRLRILGILTVPVLFAPLVLAGPAPAASAAEPITITASLPVAGDGHGGMAGMHDMEGMNDMPGMENIPGMESTPESTPPADQGDMSGMEGMEDMPGMESAPDGHSGHGSSEATSTGPEPARGIVLAGFGIFNLLVLLVAAVMRYSGSGSRRSRRNAARSASEPTSTRHKPKTGQLPS